MAPMKARRAGPLRAIRARRRVTIRLDAFRSGSVGLLCLAGSTSNSPAPVPTGRGPGEPPEPGSPRAISTVRCSIPGPRSATSCGPTPTSTSTASPSPRVAPPAGARSQPELLEIIGPPRRDDELVTTTLVGKGGRGRDDRGPREGRATVATVAIVVGPARPVARRAARATARRVAKVRLAARAVARRAATAATVRRGVTVRLGPSPRPDPRPSASSPAGPTATRCSTPCSPEQKVIAEQVLRGGIPAVRQAIEKQNEEARAAGTPEIKPEGMVTIAEQLLPSLRTAEWHDRADAALADVDEIDLRDLRSVVVAADAAARDDVTRDAGPEPARGAHPPGRPGARGLAHRAHRDPGRRPHGAGPAPELPSAQGRLAAAGRAGRPA